MTFLNPCEKPKDLKMGKKKKKVFKPSPKRRSKGRRIRPSAFAMLAASPPASRSYEVRVTSRLGQLGKPLGRETQAPASVHRARPRQQAVCDLLPRLSY